MIDYCKIKNTSKLLFWGVFYKLSNCRKMASGDGLSNFFDKFDRLYLMSFAAFCCENLLIDKAVSYFLQTTATAAMHPAPYRLTRKS